MGNIKSLGVEGGDKFRFEFIAEFINDKKWTKGAELGLEDGKTFKYLIEHCPSLKELIGVDLYEQQPTAHIEKYIPGETVCWPPGMPWEHEKYYHDITNFCIKNPVGRIIKEWTHKAVHQFPDEYFDFVFIDADHSYSTCLTDIILWYPKVKSTGRIIGHDIHFESVQQAVKKYFGKGKYKTGGDFLWWVDK